MPDDKAISQLTADTSPTMDDYVPVVDVGTSTTKRVLLSDFLGVVKVRSADPASPVNGTAWLVDDGGSPASIALKVRKGGVTYTLAEITV